jgi:hypothetical protein
MEPPFAMFHRVEFGAATNVLAHQYGKDWLSVKACSAFKPLS